MRTGRTRPLRIPTLGIHSIGNRLVRIYPVKIHLRKDTIQAHKDTPYKNISPNDTPIKDNSSRMHPTRINSVRIHLLKIQTVTINPMRIHPIRIQPIRIHPVRIRKKAFSP